MPGEQVSSGPEVVARKVEKPTANDTAAVKQSNGGDPDAQAMLIGSLRSQIQDLFSQVTQLNNKLVQSYDRVSDLEDNLHVSESNVRQSSVKISQLELERTQHLAALNTGLLVEKSHVTAELTRLMEKATDEAAQRGQAESARADIEKDLDDLSATLFDQANTMVAEARFARAQSERKVEDAEQALKGAEEAVGIMQQQMQQMQAEKQKSVKDAEDMRALMGKGKWVERVDIPSSRLVRLRSSHTPYQEFLLFVAHLRNIRPSSVNPPGMSTLLPLPFLARLLNEDSEPTVRLDLAPSLNWLSRRSVLSAIHTGQLTIEPMSSTNLLQELSLAQASNGVTSVCCALCGAVILQNNEGFNSHHSRPPPHPLSRTSSSINSISRSANLLFKNSLTSYSTTSSTNNSPPLSPHRSNFGSPVLPLQQIYIFRLASTVSTSNLGVAMLPISIATSYSGSSTPTSHQSTNHSSQNQQQTRNSQSTIYPLCRSGWCLTRLRSTCSLWAFIRTGVVEKVWEEEVSMISPTTPSKSAGDKSIGTDSSSGSKPPIPPRRRGLWGMASALGERAASWGEGEKDKGRVSSPSPSTPERELDKKLPAPPPAHPASPIASARTFKPSPPPLPKRAEGRGRVRSATVSRAATPSPAPKVIVAAVEEEVMPAINGHAPADCTGAPNVEQPEEAATVAPSEIESNVTDEVQESSRESPALSAPSHGEPSTRVADKSGPEPDLAPSMSSPDVDKRNSQDSFASAASEIVSSERASLPETATITVQEPRPASPLTLPINPSPTLTEANAGSLEPTPSAPALHNESLNDTPPPTKSSAPPPLPRRAAARARPTSVVPPPSPTTFVPEKATEAASDATMDHSETIGIDDDLATKETTTEETELSKETTDTSPVSAEPVAETVSEGNNEVAKQPRLFLTIDGEEETETERTSTPSPTDEKLSEVPSSPTKTIIDNHVNETAVDSSIPAPPQNGEDANGEVYIGDATWEERTWKELAKLKEDMFWARVGGLR